MRCFDCPELGDAAVGQRRAVCCAAQVAPAAAVDAELARLERIAAPYLNRAQRRKRDALRRAAR